jgi:hypothetical protein
MKIPQGCFSRGHMGTGVCATQEKSQREMQPVFRVQPCLCSHPPQRARVALKELLELSLKELSESTFGDIFPLRVLLAQYYYTDLEIKTMMKFR